MIRPYSILFIAIPFCVMAVSIIISMCIPGCKLDEGSGSSGCGAWGPYLSTGVWLGFPVLICGLMGLFPLGLFLFLKSIFSSKVPDKE